MSARLFGLTIGFGTAVVLASSAFAQTLDTTPTGSVLARVLGASAVDVGGLDAVNGVFLNVADSIGPRIDGSVTATFQRVRVFDNVFIATRLPDGTGSVERLVYAIDSSLGDVETTAIGSVNTGTFTLGANQYVDESTAGATRSVERKLIQLGGTRDTSALIANIAGNVSDVSGAVAITAEDVNLSAGKVSTTVLGAVNTGTIVSGVNASLKGTVSNVTGSN